MLGAVHVAVAVAGTVSGSTSLRESQGWVSAGHGPGPVLPAGHSQVALVVIVLLLVVVLVLTGQLWGRTRGQPSPGQAQPPRPGPRGPDAPSFS